MAFVLDSRLAKDACPVGRNEHSLLLMMNDRRYPWFIVVPTVADACEWFDLSLSLQQQVHADCVQLGQCVQQAFGSDKINIAALGNIVRQLHVHVVGRRQDDPAWPGPVWGHSPAEPMNTTEQAARMADLLRMDTLPFR